MAKRTFQPSNKKEKEHTVSVVVWQHQVVVM